MKSIAALPLRWRKVTLALCASVFVGGLEFNNLALGQDERKRSDQSQMQDSQRDQQRSRRRSSYRSLKVGQYAPTFTLSSPDGKETFDLRDSRDKRPVVLIFGSYT